jgi:DNA repair protein RadC
MTARGELAILSDLVGASWAGELLAQYGTARAVLMDSEALPANVGRKLRAAVDLGAALALEGGGERARYSSPAETARYLLPIYSARPVEVFGVLALDVRHRLLREEVVSVGCLTASLVHPREVFKVALDARAAALVIFHNHPSGDPEPSAEDLALTRRLAAAGSLMGVEVLDHLILGAGRFVSLKERGVVV